MIVTFDVFSALTDSRSGGGSFLQSVATDMSWPVQGIHLYDRWDALNKESHRTVAGWVPFAELSARAMATALDEFGLPIAGAAEVSDALLQSMRDWPLWPDVTVDSLLCLGSTRLGLLSNIDNQLLEATSAVRMGVFDPELFVTSQRALAYKPSPLIYRRATELIGPFVHVASSARDVRGAVSAGIVTIRLARDRHSVDPSGPPPERTAMSIKGIAGLLAQLS